MVNTLRRRRLIPSISMAASAGRPDPGRCRGRPGGRPSTACAPRRPCGWRPTTPSAPASSPRRAPPGPTVPARAAWRRSRCSERPAAPCRSARLRTRHGARRRTRRSLRWAVELRLGEIRRRLRRISFARRSSRFSCSSCLDPLRLRRGHPRLRRRRRSRPARTQRAQRLDADSRAAQRPAASCRDRCPAPCAAGAPAAPPRSFSASRVPTRRRLPRRLLLWHDSILVSKVRSLQRTQGGSGSGRRVP